MPVPSSVDIPVPVLDLALAANGEVLLSRTIAMVKGLIDEVIAVETLDDIDLAVIGPSVDDGLGHHPHGGPGAFLSVLELHFKLDLAVLHGEAVFGHHAAGEMRAGIGREVVVLLAPAVELSVLDGDEIGTQGHLLYIRRIFSHFLCNRLI